MGRRIPRRENKSVQRAGRAGDEGNQRAGKSAAGEPVAQVQIRAFFSRFARGASAKTVWGSMRAEQVSIAKRWRRPRSDPEYTEQRSDIGKISEKCSRQISAHYDRQPERHPFGGAKRVFCLVRRAAGGYRLRSGSQGAVRRYRACIPEAAWLSQLFPFCG